MRIRLKDLADQLGMSINTVSRALRDMPDIGEETKKNVREMAEKSGYLTNRAASMLRTNQSRTIGVIVTDISNPVFSSIVKGMDSAAKELGYTIILYNTNENYEDEEKAIRTMYEIGVDGILMVPSMFEDGTVKDLIEKAIPFVLIGRHFPNISTCVVSNDDVFGGYLAGQHLILKGHKEFIYITGPLRVSSAQERLVGLRKSIMQKKLSPDCIKVYEIETSMQASYEVICSLIDQNTKFTCVFCFSDFMAFGVLKALREKGKSVPGDVAVIGYDNIEFSDICMPALTTIDMSKSRLGRRSMELLVQEINLPPEERKVKQLILEPVLIVRQST